VATHKDAIKRMRQSAGRRLKNRTYRSEMRNEIKDLYDAIAKGASGSAADKEAAQEQFRKTVSVIQHVGQKGIIHARQADRRVSRLAKRLKAMAGSK
jgi:small subunit ribosomal protein S20